MRTSEHAEVEAAIFGKMTVAKEHYLRWARSSDLGTKARAFHLSSHAWNRISPEPTADEQREVVADYLLACIGQNPALDDYAHSGFIAGHELAASLKNWSSVAGASDFVAGIAKRLEALYREADTAGKSRIEWGALEHILEAPRLRQHFAHWAQDAELKQAHERALEWGLSHTEKEDG